MKPTSNGPSSPGDSTAERSAETDYPFIDVPDALGIAHYFWDEIVMADQHEVPYRRGQYHGCDGIRLWRDGPDYCYLWVEATVDHDMWMAYLLEVRTKIGGTADGFGESRDHLYLAAGGGGLFEVEWHNKPIRFDAPLDDHIDHHRAAMHWFVERDVGTIEEQNGGDQGIIDRRRAEQSARRERPMSDQIAEAAPSERVCEHPGLDHDNSWSYCWPCPKCGICKFIGHGPLCAECALSAAPRSSENPHVHAVARETATSPTPDGFIVVTSWCGCGENLGSRTDRII